MGTFTGRKRRVAVTTVALALSSFLLATPSFATLSASYGTSSSTIPVLVNSTTAGCANNCMTATVSFTASGSSSTTVQIIVALYRYKSATQSAPNCTAGGACSDTLLSSKNVSVATKSGTKSTTSMTTSTSCGTVQSTATGYYTRLEMSNGTTTVYAESSAVLKAKGC